MRNLIKILLAILLGFNGILTVGAKEYADVKSGEEFYEAIEYASDNNIVGGYSDGTFRAYEGVTRAEFTKMLINFKYTQEEINGCDKESNSFPDVAESYVHSRYICVAKEEGILNGYSDGTFKPEQKITTPEGIKIISNTYGYTEGNSDNFDKYFEALENRSALPEASMWWPEELWRGEVMEVLYRLEESLTDREAITYNQYKEHQEWKEVVLEDAGIKFSVPSWFESNANTLPYIYEHIGEFDFIPNTDIRVDNIKFAIDINKDLTNYYSLEQYENLMGTTIVSEYFPYKNSFENLQREIYVAKYAEELSLWEVYHLDKGKNVAFSYTLSRNYPADTYVSPKDSIYLVKAVKAKYQRVLDTILESRALI